MTSRRLLLATVLLAASAAAAAPPPVLFVPDVPTDDPGGSGTIFHPWDVIRYGAGAYSPVPVLTIPGNPAIDALTKMDKPGNWLLSVEAPSDLAGHLPTAAEPRDVVRLDTALGYTVFFCGAGVGLPADADIDAVYLEGGDTGNLIVSFESPTTIGGITFDPADLVRFKPTGGGTCASWGLSASNPAFDASSAGAGIPTSANVVGAAVVAGRLVLAFDTPVDLAPSLGPTTYLPGQLVSWDGANFSVFDALASWPISSVVNAFTYAANPGRVPPTIHVDKSAIVAGGLHVTWQPSCSSGASDYGIYEGTIGSWYSHTQKVCTDTGSDLMEDFVPGSGNTYYLVVPQNGFAEGSYGLATGGERPIGVATCQPSQTITPCPP